MNGEAGVPEPLNSSWTRAYRKFLAQRRQEDYVAALRLAPKPVAYFLECCKTRDIARTNELVQALIEQLPLGLEGEEGLTVYVAYLDQFALLAVSFRKLHPHKWNQSFQQGVEGCQAAIEISQKLGDLACGAFYTTLMTTGFQSVSAHRWAVAPLTHAVRMYTQLAVVQPEDYRHRVAGVLNDLGIALRELGKLKFARRTLEKALAVCQTLPKAALRIDPNLLPAALTNLGNVYYNLGEFVHAREKHEEALTFYRELGAVYPTYKLSMATTLMNLGNVLFGQRDFTAACTTYQEAVAILTALAKDNQGVFQSELALTLRNLGNSLREAGQPIAAREQHEEAVAIYRELADAQPEVYRSELAAALNSLGADLCDSGESMLSCNAHREALLIYTTVSDYQRKDVQLPIVKTLNKLGHALFDARDYSEARESYQDAMAVCNAMLREQRKAFEPELAENLRGLANVLREIRDLRGAREKYEEALAIYRKVAIAQPQDFGSVVALTFGGLGSVLIELNELAAAEHSFREAGRLYAQLDWSDTRVELAELAVMLNNDALLQKELFKLSSASDKLQTAMSIYERLVKTGSSKYLPRFAETLHNLGSLQRKQGNLIGARKSVEGALQIFKDLATVHPDVYWREVAMALNGLSNLLEDLGEPLAARRMCEEALSILEARAQLQWEVYGHLLAIPLNSMGNILRHQGELDAACTAYKRSREVLRQAENWIDATKPSIGMGYLALQCNDRGQAKVCFQDAMQDLRRGLGQLSTPEHHDKFKSALDDVASRLILLYAEELDSEPTAAVEIAVLLESLRRHDLIADSGGIASTLPREVAGGTGWLAMELESRRAALLWIQATDDGIVFAIQRPLHTMVVEVAPRTWLEKFEWLLNELRDLIGSSEFERMVLDPTRYQGSVADRTIRGLMREAFALLPAKVKELFLGDEEQMVFISACGLTIDFPLELMLIPEQDGTERFLGLQSSLPRVHGLFELREVLGRHGEHGAGRCVVIGDPATGINGMERLVYAFDAAQSLMKLLTASGLHAEDAYSEKATSQWTLERLNDRDLDMFVFLGHGGPGLMALAGEGIITTVDLEGTNWQRGPFIHLDCCNAGSEWSRGGGRSWGLPGTFLRGGASSVLASYHPLYDQTAAEFSAVFYEGFLHERLDLAAALLKARRAIHARHGDNPVLWATSVLWGNPATRFVCNSERPTTMGKGLAWADFNAR